MLHAKQASSKRKRRIYAVPVLSAAVGLSLSLASGASAAIGRPAAHALTPKTATRRGVMLVGWNWLIDELGCYRLPSVDFRHGDLTGSSNAQTTWPAPQRWFSTVSPPTP